MSSWRAPTIRRRSSSCARKTDANRRSAWSRRRLTPRAMEMPSAERKIASTPTPNPMPNQTLRLMSPIASLSESRRCSTSTTVTTDPSGPWRGTYTSISSPSDRSPACARGSLRSETCVAVAPPNAATAGVESSKRSPIRSELSEYRIRPFGAQTLMRSVSPPSSSCCTAVVNSAKAVEPGRSSGVSAGSAPTSVAIRSARA